MTYDDNRNRPVRDPDGWSTGPMLGIALALVLGLGVLFWALSGDRQTASNPNPPATTTGQGSGQDAPPPARTPAPAPAAKGQ